MKEFELKYGCNPNQKPARIFMEEGDLPLKVLNGRPGYINFMDALNSWQLVKALKKATGLPAAASLRMRAKSFSIFSLRFLSPLSVSAIRRFAASRSMVSASASRRCGI